MFRLLRKERNYHIGTSSEHMRRLMVLPQQPDGLPKGVDPYLSSLTTSREVRKAQRERLFMPLYPARETHYNRVKGREPEYRSLSNYVSILQRQRNAMLHR